jgi:hypothetical protein
MPPSEEMEMHIASVPCMTKEMKQNIRFKYQKKPKKEKAFVGILEGERKLNPSR